MVKLSKGKIQPPDYADREPYNTYGDMPILPKWLRQLISKCTGKPLWEETEKGKTIIAGYHEEDAIKKAAEDVEEVAKF